MQIQRGVHTSTEPGQRSNKGRSRMETCTRFMAYFYHLAISACGRREYLYLDQVDFPWTSVASADPDWHSSQAFYDLQVPDHGTINIRYAA